MEKPTWRKIQKNNTKPCPRWGHASCTIEDQVLFFGGYADSNYMNDLWTYHATEKVWTEVQTHGQRPSHRSNCTLSYNPQTNEVIVFGGGGPNKQRFNSISILNWSTKEWRQIVPKENEAAPWERTYHVAELKYPYLIIFGGQGLADMEDLWVFNFQTERWTEIKIDKNQVKPCARRFHSSCMIDNEFYVVAGCHAKYRCLSDVYSLDLTPLLETGKTDKLKWTQRKLKGASFLSRWGHSSVVFDKKIYVFAGRFSNDLNDILVIDVSNNTLKGLKMGGNPIDHPKPRRRHCASFMGSCMIIFGGFNGDYFNDLHYINVFELSNKTSSLQQELTTYVNNSMLSQKKIRTCNGQEIAIHTSLLARFFNNQKDLNSFINSIDGKYQKGNLTLLLENMYRGYGKSHNISEKLGINLPQSLNRRWLLNQLLKEEPNLCNFLAIAHNTNQKTTDHVVSLKRQDFDKYIERKRELWFLDSCISVGKSRVHVNKQQISIHSPYFRNLLSNKFSKETHIPLPSTSPIVLDIILGALTIGVLVVPNDYSLMGWMQIAELTDYFCLKTLKSVCETQLCTKVTSENYKMLQQLASDLEMENLSLYCANQALKTQKDEQQSHIVSKMRSMMRLQLAHQRVEVSSCSGGIVLKKGVSEGVGTQQKQNNRECSNI